MELVKTVPIHVEIQQNKSSSEQMISLVKSRLLWDKLYSDLVTYQYTIVLKPDSDSNRSNDLTEHIDSITLSLARQQTEENDLIHYSIQDNDIEALDLMGFETNEFYSYKYKFYVYQLNYESMFEEDQDSEDQLSSAQHTILPSYEFHGLWESLIFENNIKEQLLNFVLTSLKFADMKVNPNLITWNKVVLLHGPPGTGKTSLCKALAHKLSIRLKDKYKFCQLIEINSHSLFSKWFSESGKLVMKLFQKIKEYVETNDHLVFILIDEVESLAHTRQSTGTDPSDAIRVVNALLTQIDNIKRYPNVIILTTSNVTGAIDLAFVDRADIKQFINLPCDKAIYDIYYSCVHELIFSGVLMKNQEILSRRDNEFANCLASQYLMEISRQSQGLSGRTLRKLAFLAVALYSNNEIPLKLNDFLDHLFTAVKKQFQERNDLFE